VDRTADVKLAARELVAARFAFGGSSPYAPDLVLVNEFVKQEFLQAVGEETRRLGEGKQQQGYGSEKKAKGSGKASEKIEKFRKSDSKVEVVLEEAGAVVLDLHARRPEMLETKTDAPVLAVHAVKSLDDAIDFIGSAEGGPALAAYHFGSPQVGKYLAQFVDARVSFVNHIPRDLLVGPARPVTQAVDASATYTVEMFSLARPAFIAPSSSSSEIAAALSSATGSRKLLEQALSPLKAMKRNPGGGVGMLSLVESCMFVRYADILCARFLRAGLADQCWHDPYCHHQCDGGWDDLAGEEWKDSVFWVEGLGVWCRDFLGRGCCWVCGSAHVDNVVEKNVGPRSILRKLASADAPMLHVCERARLEVTRECCETTKPEWKKRCRGCRHAVGSISLNDLESVVLPSQLIVPADRLATHDAVDVGALQKRILARRGKRSHHDWI
jgi:hypothetical protein